MAPLITVKATLAGVLLLLASSSPASAWPHLIPSAIRRGDDSDTSGSGSGFKFCIPFITCNRRDATAVAVQSRQEKPGGPNVTLERVDYGEIIRAVTPYMPRFNARGIAYSGGTLRAGVQVSPPPKPRAAPPRGGGGKYVTRRGDGRPGAATTAEEEEEKRDLFTYAHISPANRTSLPYSAIGKLVVQRNGKSAPLGWDDCTGALVNDTLMLTADHCLPWASGNAADWNTVEFIPAYDGRPGAANPRPRGSAFVKRCWGINPPQQDGRDLAVCELGAAIGKGAGALQVRIARAGGAEEDDFFFGPAVLPPGQDFFWSSVGYPTIWDLGLDPALETYVDLAYVDPNAVDGGSVVTSAKPYVDHGWSGGPLFRYDTQDCPGGYAKGQACPFIGAVVTANAGPIGAGFFDSTVHAAGYRMLALATYGEVKLGLAQVNTSPP